MSYVLYDVLYVCSFYVTSKIQFYSSTNEMDNYFSCIFWLLKIIVSFGSKLAHCMAQIRLLFFLVFVFDVFMNICSSCELKQSCNVRLCHTLRDWSSMGMEIYNWYQTFWKYLFCLHCTLVIRQYLDKPSEVSSNTLLTFGIEIIT